MFDPLLCTYLGDHQGEIQSVRLLSTLQWDLFRTQDLNLLFIYLFIYLFIIIFLAVLGLRFCARAFSSCGKWGPLFITVRRPLTVAASPLAEHRLQTRRLSSCGTRAQLLRGMWDPPRPGLEPVSPALAGGLLTTAPPGKPPKPFKSNFLNSALYHFHLF